MSTDGTFLFRGSATALITPFSDGKIDFNRVAYQLFEANYNGTIMLEVLKERSPIYKNKVIHNSLVALPYPASYGDASEHRMSKRSVRIVAISPHKLVLQFI